MATKTDVAVLPASKPEGTHDTTDAPANLKQEASSGLNPLHAIGRVTLQEYVKDQTRMEFPSWVNPPPISFGTTQYGNLSANQWRTVGTINLPIKLIRTWSLEGGRRAAMVRNFLELVEAIEMIGLLEIDEDSIQHAEYLMKSYLDTAKDLYRWAKIQPNHHMALHLGIFLRLFGPAHSWRAFVFKRFNYFLQSFNTNMNFGEMETTFMMQTCRVANFRPLLRAPPICRAMPEFIRVLEDVHRKDHRGMRLDSLLRLDDKRTPQGDPGSKHSRVSIPHRGLI
ncbi:hypothetical protein LXA43DRAFT_1092756 [Ganoderma leucocontextum]|nr:hypothetical protein LXA43DRAFT_1092756 [Ganoderma leucocontextum]